VSEVRAQGLLDYPHAHALLGFLAARDRATRPDYQPTARTWRRPAAGFQAIEAANGSGDRGHNGHASEAHPRSRAARPGARPYGAPLRRPDGRPPGRRGATRPARAAGRQPPLPCRLPVRRATRSRCPARPPLAGAAARASSPWCSPGSGRVLPVRAPPAAGSAGWTRGGAYQAGRRDDARRAFDEAARANPKLALPHVFLGRMAREDATFQRATTELTRALELEPKNPTAARGDGSVQLVSGRPDLAVRFFTPRARAGRSEPAGGRRDGVRPDAAGQQRGRGSVLRPRRVRLVGRLSADRARAARCPAASCPAPPAVFPGAVPGGAPRGVGAPAP
jgi:hypothetical protein